MSNTLKHVVCLVLVAAGGAVAALAKAHPEYQWTGVALAILGALGNMFTEAPQTAAKMARLTAALGKAGPAAILIACVAAGSQVGCANTQQGIQAGVASVELAICILNTFSADKAAGKSDGDAVADTIARCATDAEAVARVLDASKAAQARLATKAAP